MTNIRASGFTLLDVLESIMYYHEESLATKQYDLTRDEYLFLYTASTGHNIVEVVDYLDRSSAQAYKIRRKLVKKFGVTNFRDVLQIFDKLDNKK